MKVVALVERSWYGLMPAGGAETMIHSLMAYLASVGWDAVGIVTGGPTATMTLDGVTVYAQPDKHVHNSLIKDADLIITHLGEVPRAKVFGRLHSIPVVQLIHNTSPYTTGFLGSGCDFAIYNSRWVKSYHEAEKAKHIIQVITGPKTTSMQRRTAYDWPSIVVTPPVASTGRRVGDPDGYITLVNLVPNKGPDVFYELARRNPELKFMAVIGGYELDDQVIEDLPNVTIQEHVKDMDEVYSKSAVVLMPSKYESYGRVAVEALQYGIPVIASDTPGLTEALGRYGTLRDRTDIDGWNWDLHDILENYKGYQAEAYDRYDFLCRLSEAELPAFQQAMKGLVESWESSPSGT